MLKAWNSKNMAKFMPYQKNKHHIDILSQLSDASTARLEQSITRSLEGFAKLQALAGIRPPCTTTEDLTQAET